MQCFQDSHWIICLTERKGTLCTTDHCTLHDDMTYDIWISDRKHNIALCTATTRRLLENIWGTLSSTDRCRRVRAAWPWGLRGSFVAPSALAPRPQSAQTASRETWQFRAQIQLKPCTTKMRTQKSACAITDIYLSITRQYQILNVFLT